MLTLISTSTNRGAILISERDGARFEVSKNAETFSVASVRTVNGGQHRCVTQVTKPQFDELCRFDSEVPGRDSNLEIERKWRPSEAQHLQELQQLLTTSANATTIQQGYLLIDGSEVRLRRADERYFLTMKSSGALTRCEVDVAITAQQFSELWPATEGRRLEKVRYVLSIAQEGGVPTVVEIDKFQGAHDKLVLVECEFKNAADAESFRAPACFGLDVTHRVDHKNKSLVCNGVPALLLTGLVAPSRIRE